LYLIISPCFCFLCKIPNPKWESDPNQNLKTHQEMSNENLKTTVTHHYNNGSKMYEGQVQNGQWNGTGDYFRDDHTLAYRGGFKDSQWHGPGVMYWANGQISYQGEFDMGQWHG
jgi:hypothetical protein